jgi:osmotically-inducible protein OsmY
MTDKQNARKNQRRKSARAGSEGRRRDDAPGSGRRAIKRDEDSTQLLERGEGPAADETMDPAVDSPSETTMEGGPGTDAAYREGGPRTRGETPPNQHGARTGGQGGYSTLGGGVYPDEGSPEDAPRQGDWQRHGTGATSGARGQEGLGFPGARTWGEDQYRREQREQQGQSSIRRPGRGVRRPDATLAGEIQEILTNDPELDSTDIEVAVEGGAVTLTGTVDSSDAKLLAEELTESVAGVREVHNRLKVAR